MLQPITDFLNIFGEATVPMVLLIAFTALFAAKVIVSERSRRALRSDLTELLKQATTPLEADTGLLVFIDPESDELFAEVGVGLNEELFRRGRSLRRGIGVSGRVAETGQSVVVVDMNEDARFRDHPLHDTLRKRRIQSVISVPLNLGDRIIGVITLSSHNPGQFSEEDVPFVEAIADKIALTIGNEHIFEVTRTNWEES